MHFGQLQEARRKCDQDVLDWRKYWQSRSDQMSSTSQGSIDVCNHHRVYSHSVYLLLPCCAVHDGGEKGWPMKKSRVLRQQREATLTPANTRTEAAVESSTYTSTTHALWKSSGRAGFCPACFQRPPGEHRNTRSRPSTTRRS